MLIYDKKEDKMSVGKENKGVGPIPDYETLHLPVAEEFCTQQQITLHHTVLMADHSGIQMIIDSISKIKDNVEELMKQEG